jgi:phenylacetate-CoA ligase
MAMNSDDALPNLRAGVEGLLWPTMPDGRTAFLLSLLWQLERTQWWPPERLHDYQSRQLAVLLRHAAEHVPLYRERLGSFRGDATAAYSEKAWRAIAPLTRKEIQGAGNELRSTAVPKEHGTVAKTQTSGSTGQPVTVFKTTMALLFWHAITLRDHAWHRRRLDLKLAVIRANMAVKAEPPDGAALPDWGPPTSWLYATGPSVLLRLGLDVDLQAAWLARHDPHYLLTYPNNLDALLSHFAARGLRLPALREVRAVGETVHPELRARCQEVLGVPLVDLYSSQEVGYMALQCPDGPFYHLQSETALVEVVDDEGRPCAPGEIGRILVTPLHNFAMPLIRYEIRDYAEVGPPCACGRGLPTLARIVGRQRNMVRLPNGQSRWPMIGFKQYEAIAPIRQYQFVQHSLERLEMRIVAARPLTKEDEARLTEVVCQALGHPFGIDFVYRDDLPIGPNGKFEEFICALPDQNAVRRAQVEG